MSQIKYEIIKNIGTISESPKGWTKELNLISWNAKGPKYDLKDWVPEHEKMGKGSYIDERRIKGIEKYFK